MLIVSYLEPSPETKDISLEHIFVNGSRTTGYWVLLGSPGRGRLARAADRRRDAAGLEPLRSRGAGGSAGLPLPASKKISNEN